MYIYIYGYCYYDIFNCIKKRKWLTTGKIRHNFASRSSRLFTSNGKLRNVCTIVIHSDLKCDGEQISDSDYI